MFHLLEKASSSIIYGIFLIKLSFCESLSADIDWSYEDQESWNVQCAGTRQSPIDIPRRGRYISSFLLQRGLIECALLRSCPGGVCSPRV